MGGDPHIHFDSLGTDGGDQENINVDLPMRESLYNEYKNAVKNE